MPAPLTFVRSATFAIISGLLSGCAAWRPVTVPIGTLAEPARCATRPDTLIVMLPGAGSRPEDFATEGFVQAVRQRQLAADIVLVDAHRGYFNDLAIIERLRADVIAPARARGYAQIWLVGISLGAFGSLVYAAERPAGITGIVALGPYLGSPEKGAEVAAAGGLTAWRGPATAMPGDFEAKFWRWLQSFGAPIAQAGGQASSPRPTLLLGYGLEDRFRPNHDLLAAALPPAQVFTTPGGHDWAPWLALWQRMLDAMPLRTDSSCRGGAVG